MHCGTRANYAVGEENPRAYLKGQVCNRTFLMLKPDAVQRGMTGKIVAPFELKGFNLCAMKLCIPGRAHMEAHFADLSDKILFASLVEYMISSHVCAMVSEGDEAAKFGLVGVNSAGFSTLF